MRSILLSPRVLVFGLLSWLLPFVFSILFFDQTGQLAISKPLFKSVMVVAAGGVGAALMVFAFRRIEPSLLSGLVIGFYWLALNLVFDILVLVPLSGMSVGDYFIEIGLRYLLIPIFAVAMGVVGGQQGSVS